MNQWDEMTAAQQAEALAKLLGWEKDNLLFAKQPGNLFWFVDGKAVCALVDFHPLTDWHSMGLVVEAMAEKGWIVDIRIMSDRAECIISPRQEIGDPAANTTYVVAGRAPAAVAEAVYKALGGE